MSVYEHLQDLYEFSRYGSSEYQISESLLTHFSRVDSMTLRQIAEGSYVAKGTVSKFMRRLTQRGTFEAFQNAVTYDARVQATLLQSARELADAAGGLPHAAPPDAAEELVRALRGAGRVLVMASRESAVTLRPVLSVLLYRGVAARAVGEYYTQDLGACLADMDSCDVLLFATAEASAYERLLRLNFEGSLIAMARASRARVYAVGRGWGTFANVRLITLRPEATASGHDLMKIFAAQLLAGLL